MKFKYVIYLLIPFFHPLKPQNFRYIVQNTKDFFNAGGEFFTDPLRFDSKDWLTFSSLIVGTALGFLADNTLKNFSLKNHSSLNDGLFKIDNDSLPADIVIIGGTYLTGWLVNYAQLTWLDHKPVEISAYVPVVTLFIKGATSRSQLLTGRSYNNFRPFRFNIDQSSLPSGHATFAFAFSTIMANFYDNTYWNIARYFVAGLIGTVCV
jgi:membrane-associated phospholipid phosphatase